MGAGVWTLTYSNGDNDEGNTNTNKKKTMVITTTIQSRIVMIAIKKLCMVVEMIITVEVKRQY